MATKKQVAANRRNARKSTGPRTEAGKAVSSRNAMKHGLLAQRVVLSDEDAGAFDELRMEVLAELEPVTRFEQLLVERIVAAQWRLARLPGLEAELFEKLRRGATGEDDGLGAAWMRDAGPYGGALSRLARYETMLERSLVRMLGELRKAQAERRKYDAQFVADWQERRESRTMAEAEAEGAMTIEEVLARRFPARTATATAASRKDAMDAKGTATATTGSRKDAKAQSTAKNGNYASRKDAMDAKGTATATTASRKDAKTQRAQRDEWGSASSVTAATTFPLSAFGEGREAR